MSLNKLGNGEKSKKKSSFLGKLSKKIEDTYFPDINHKEAWNKFPENVKKEMMESLSMKDNIDLDSIDLTDSCILEPTYKGDIPDFKEGIVQIDKIGNYIMINGIKCREYQPGISGFVYKDINNKYNHLAWLKIGFCKKGAFIEFTILGPSGRAKEEPIPPSKEEIEAQNEWRKANENAWNRFSEKTKKEMLDSLSEKDVFNWTESDVYDLSDLKFGDYLSGIGEYHEFKEGVVQRDEIGNFIMINGMKCREYQPGISGFVYRENFLSRYDNDRIEIGFCEKGTFIKKMTIER